MDILAKDYRAGIGETNEVQVQGSTFGSLIKNLKKIGNIDCRKTHKREVIFSEFREGAWGIFFWNRHTCALDAWIEWR